MWDIIYLGRPGDLHKFIVCWLRLETSGESLNFNLCHVRCNLQCYFYSLDTQEVFFETKKKNFK